MKHLGHHCFFTVPSLTKPPSLIVWTPTNLSFKELPLIQLSVKKFMFDLRPVLLEI